MCAALSDELNCDYASSYCAEATSSTDNCTRAFRALHVLFHMCHLGASHPRSK